MNIAYICTDFGVPVFGFKGASIHVREMVAAMCRAGHSVRIISPAMNSGKGAVGTSNMGEGGALQEVEPPVELNWLSASEQKRLTCLSVPPAPEHLQFTRELKRLDLFFGQDSRLRQEVRNLLYNLSLQDTVLQDLKTRRIDFIYERYTLFSRAGILLARELGIPHILEVNAPLAYEQEKMRGLEMKDMARDMELQIYRETDRAMVVSDELKSFLITNGVPDERVTVLPNGVDPWRFTLSENDEDVREKYNLGNKTVIGFVGSLKPWHGTKTLLEAFQQLRASYDNIHLLIVGDGPRREALEAYTAEHQLESSVTFTGKIQHDDIPRYIAAMDITAAPYIPNDNFYFSPIKIFEYMIMKKPVIGARIGQVEKLIKSGETGLLFEAGDIPGLAKVLQQLIDQPAVAQEMGETASRWVRAERTWDNNLAQVIAVVDQIRNS